MANADLDDIKQLINSCSFFNNKSVNLIKMAKEVATKYSGVVPNDENALKALGGVGQKTAHVFLIEYYGHNFMAVDTHVFRTSHRLGISTAKSAVKCEEELVAAFKSYLSPRHQGLVLFGRYICKSKNPLCERDCFLR
jgi:endonuclease-3